MRKRPGPDRIASILRDVQADLHAGLNVRQACRKAAIASTTYYRWKSLQEGLPAVVGRGSDAGLAASLVDVQAGVEVGLELSKDGCNLVWSRAFSHGSLPGSLPVVRFPLRLDQVLGSRPE